MSQENVEFLSGLFGATQALDKEALLAALPAFIEQTADPGFEWSRTRSEPTAGPRSSTTGRAREALDRGPH